MECIFYSFWQEKRSRVTKLKKAVKFVIGLAVINRAQIGIYGGVMMNKYYTIILAILQIFVSILAFIYLIKDLLGEPVTMSPTITILLALLGLVLGCKNAIKFKRLNKK